MEYDYHEAMKLANQLCFPLYAASRNVTNLYTPWLKPLGLTYTQYIVFLALLGKGWGIGYGDMEKTKNERRTGMKTVYDFTVKDRQGNDVSLSEYQGKVLLIVNTATGCGFTPHYEPLEAMYKEFKDRGFEILDFPCNQFANQAPGSDEEIHDFCTLKFGTEFPQFKKIDVNGETADPLYAFLASEKPFEGFGKGLKNAALNKFADMNNKKYGDKTYIGWNFTKFLIDREGKVIARFEPTVDMKDVREAVAAAL